MKSMDNFIIIDDVIDNIYQDAVENFFLKSNFPWFYQSDISFSDDHISKLSKDIRQRPGFSNLIHDVNTGPFNPFHFVMPILYAGANKKNITINHIIQARSFLLIPPNLSSNEDRRDRPHIDFPNPHYAAIYYVNDADGDTCIYDKQFNCNIDSPMLLNINPASLPIVKQITPKKGRLVIFNGLYYHSSSQPEYSSRCIINFNFS
jgi:hypothetical protein